MFDMFDITQVSYSTIPGNGIIQDQSNDHTQRAKPNRETRLAAEWAKSWNMKEGSRTLQTTPHKGVNELVARELVI